MLKIVDGIQVEVQANSGEKRYFYLKIGENWLKMAKIPLFHTFLAKKSRIFEVKLNELFIV